MDYCRNISWPGAATSLSWSYTVDGYTRFVKHERVIQCSALLCTHWQISSLQQKFVSMFVSPMKSKVNTDSF